MQSSTTPDIGYQWKSSKLTIRHAKPPSGFRCCQLQCVDSVVVNIPFILLPLLWGFRVWPLLSYLVFNVHLVLQSP